MDQVSQVERRSVVCREIAADDIEAVAALLTKGFAAWRDRAFWARALQRLEARAAPAGLPRLGYLLEASGVAVGVLLLIASEGQGGSKVRRCNVSGWYVETEFRVYATLLVRRALRHADVSYLNVTPAPETWAVLRAQGYRQYARGRAVGIPLLARGGRAARVVEAGEDLLPGCDLEPGEVGLLREHAGWGCVSLICQTASGRVPFVFGLRRRRGVVPFAYLIYCRGVNDLVRCARPLGWALARRGVFLVVVDAEGKIAGLPGWFEDNHPKFFLGGEAPPPSDLAYTERAIFGV